MVKHIITDGSRFIYRNHSDKYVPILSKIMKDIFSKKQVDVIFNNLFPKVLKSVFYVKKYDKPPD